MVARWLELPPSTLRNADRSNGRFLPKPKPPPGQTRPTGRFARCSLTVLQVHLNPNAQEERHEAARCVGAEAVEALQEVAQEAEEVSAAEAAREAGAVEAGGASAPVEERGGALALAEALGEVEAIEAVRNRTVYGEGVRSRHEFYLGIEIGLIGLGSWDVCGTYPRCTLQLIIDWRTIPSARRTRSFEERPSFDLPQM